MMRAYNLQLEQLHWRRWCIANKCNGDVAQFCGVSWASRGNTSMGSGGTILPSPAAVYSVGSFTGTGGTLTPAIVKLQ